MLDIIFADISGRDIQMWGLLLFYVFLEINLAGIPLRQQKPQTTTYSPEKLMELRTNGRRRFVTSAEFGRRNRFPKMELTMSDVPQSQIFSSYAMKKNLEQTQQVMKRSAASPMPVDVTLSLIQLFKLRVYLHGSSDQRQMVTSHALNYLRVILENHVSDPRISNAILDLIADILYTNGANDLSDVKYSIFYAVSLASTLDFPRGDSTFERLRSIFTLLMVKMNKDGDLKSFLQQVTSRNCNIYFSTAGAQALLSLANVG